MLRAGFAADSTSVKPALLKLLRQKLIDSDDDPECKLIEVDRSCHCIIVPD
eukprot:SAG31_NODE_26280_length_445_cov_0.745665_1_plen_50_part_10